MKILLLLPVLYFSILLPSDSSSSSSSSSSSAPALSSTSSSSSSSSLSSAISAILAFLDADSKKAYQYVSNLGYREYIHRFANIILPKINEELNVAGKLKIAPLCKLVADYLGPISYKQYQENGKRLIEAAKMDDVKIIREFSLLADADINQADTTNNTALDYAVENENIESINLLLSFPGILNRSIDRALAYAIENDLLPIVNAFLSHIQPDKKINNYGTPLMYAAKEGRKEVVELILSSGKFDPAVEIENKTALDFAVENGHEDIAEILLKRLIPDINAKDSEGRTALIKAVISTKTELVNFLLRHGADLKITSKGGQTALDYANELNEDGSFDEIIELLEQYSDI